MFGIAKDFDLLAEYNIQALVEGKLEKQASKKRERSEKAESPTLVENPQPEKKAKADPEESDK